MHFVIALTFSVCISSFWVALAYEMRKEKMREQGFYYKIWLDYLYVYGAIVASASSTIGISSALGG